MGTSRKQFVVAGAPAGQSTGPNLLKSVAFT
jgi:hypothetical protein